MSNKNVNQYSLLTDIATGDFLYLWDTSAGLSYKVYVNDIVSVVPSVPNPSNHFTDILVDHYAWISGLVGGNTGTHVLVSKYGGILAGSHNSVSGSGSAILGGQYNQITTAANQSFIGVGNGNVISARDSIICGGDTNTVSQIYGTIMGGFNNSVTQTASFVGNGDTNSILASPNVLGYSSIINGTTNFTNADYAFIGGGDNHKISGDYAVIVGGRTNLASGHRNFIGAGNDNETRGSGGAIVAGSHNKVTGDYGFIGAGENNLVIGNSGVIGGGGSNFVSGACSVVGGGINNRVSGINSFIGGGLRNFSSGDHSVIGGGTDNAIYTQRSTIGGGDSNFVSGNRSTIAGGGTNTINGARSTIAGGTSHIAEGIYTFIGGGNSNRIWTDNTLGAASIVGGENNQIIGSYGAILGGDINKVSGVNGIVLGGSSNVSSGRYSLTVGQKCEAFQNGAALFGDSTDVLKKSYGQDSFTINYSGGTWITGGGVNARRGFNIYPTGDTPTASVGGRSGDFAYKDTYLYVFTGDNADLSNKNWGRIQLSTLNSTPPSVVSNDSSIVHCRGDGSYDLTTTFAPVAFGGASVIDPIISVPAGNATFMFDSVFGVERGSVATSSQIVHYYLYNTSDNRMIPNTSGYHVLASTVVRDGGMSIPIRTITGTNYAAAKNFQLYARKSAEDEGGQLGSIVKVTGTYLSYVKLG